MRRLLLAFGLAGLAACTVAEYTIGGAAASATGGSCPDGQVVCGDGCAPAGECDDCPIGQVRCDDVCRPEGACDPVEDCPVGQVACGDGCAAPDACPCDAGCDGERETCEGDVCRCRPGLVRCGGACVDTRNDPAHCDGCDRPCDAESACQDGACVAQCDAPKVECDGACVDTATDSLHCGDCDKICSADELCLSGQCRPYVPIDGCSSCPCAEACESEDTDGDGLSCCDSPFLDAPVCVASECP